jgi:hypothetical protein
VQRCIENIDIFHYIKLPLVLPKRTNRDAVGAITPHILHQHIGTIGLERHAILKVLAKEFIQSIVLAVSIVHHRILDHNI